ncbi:hypothetical protein Zmor_023150 [Zophobas morio]|uniref:Uncharacterized protein n=1 Tax=Zophobas morio TaxID=2755281 RepID=A0AA38M666_9CUCU|nr:hypothetical protein Zmor_023150 [Zophobas morio]
MLPSLGDHTAPRGRAQTPGFLHPILRVSTDGTNKREFVRGAVLMTPRQKVHSREGTFISSPPLLNLLRGHLRHVHTRRASALTYTSGAGKNPDLTSTTPRSV